jgi:DNA-3-methyladenine glycosylase
MMFGDPSIFYIYLCYGVHEMLNIVTRENGYPAAVLIRGITSENTHFNGPGRVTKFFGIGRNLNGAPATKASGLWFEDRGVKPPAYQKLPRVGVAYAGPIWSKKLLRFQVKV